jgi:hypothetical protein
MPWKCPACATKIAQEGSATTPIIGVVYRCHVCRLELVVDPSSGKLQLAPLDPPEPAPRKFPL